MLVPRWVRIDELSLLRTAQEGRQIVNVAYHAIVLEFVLLISSPHIVRLGYIVMKNASTVSL